jgi:hypothetical protein
VANRYSFSYRIYLYSMVGRVNKKSIYTPKEKNFFVGAFKGEVRKVRAIYSKALRVSEGNQTDHKMILQVCGPIPYNQDALAAVARGERPDSDLKNQVLHVRVI